MPKQMWFGNERHFQWVPCPATGMQVSREGVSDDMIYDNGRLGIRRTMQTHQRFNMDFPVQEATGLTGLDVFSRYAAGFYGDGDDYPLFFADPMNYDQNLLPANWSAPGLYASGWASIADDTPRWYQNLVVNPSVEVASTGWSALAGTGGTATGARFSAGSSAVSGTWTYRVSWTVATSAVSGGLRYTGVPVQEGIFYGGFISVRSSKTQRVQLVIRFRNAATTSVGTTTSAETVLSANTWAKLEAPAIAAPAGAVTIDVEVQAIAGTSGANWAASDTFQGDAVFVYASSSGNPSAYFDGSSENAAWRGTAHASVSDRFVASPSVVVSDTPANAYNMPEKQATFDLISTQNARPTFDNQFGSIPYALIPIPPGYTLWLGAMGSATGAAVVRVHGFNSPADPANPAISTTLTLLSPTGGQKLNASFSSASYEYVKIFLQRTSSAASTITLAGMMAQLWPTGVTPPLSLAGGGDFIMGRGHRGLKFAGPATVESYVVVDPNRNVPVHYKGMSTVLAEAQDNA